MRRNLYILFAVGIICITAITSCGTKQEDAAAQHVYVDWEQGFHKGNLKKDGNSRMYALDYRKLIEYFLGMECQQKIWDDGTDVKKLLSAKKDGTPYTGEFRELLRSAVPYKDDCPIYDIIAEEAGAFWSGQKDATEVTRLIDRRVQLYLDENK